MVGTDRSKSQEDRLSVTALLCGGMGNQLFQYATARAVAIRNNATLVLNASRYGGRDPFKRSYALSCFDLPAKETRVETRKSAAVSRTRRALARLGPYAWNGVIVEPKRGIDKQLNAFAMTSCVTLDGYWQNEDYFRDVSIAIRRDLQFADAARYQTTTIAKSICASPVAIAVHVRRLHEVPAANGPKPLADAERLGLALPVSYYRDAISLIDARVRNAHFFIFTDFTGWAARNIAPLMRAATILPQGERPDSEDLWLISRCKHHVIANSSFSWWGAWLASGDGQIVIGPASGRHRAQAPEAWLEV